MGSTSQVPRRSKFSIIVILLYFGVYKWKESIRRLSLFALNSEVGEENETYTSTCFFTFSCSRVCLDTAYFAEIEIFFAESIVDKDKS